MANFYKPKLEVISLNEFADIWVDVYNKMNLKFRDEDYYNNNICLDTKDSVPLKEENIYPLFIWKNGGNLSKKKREIVDKIVDKLKNLNQFRKRKDVKWTEFKEFYIETILKCTNGKIWGVFIAHIAQPTKFPILDQHVVRAYNYITTGKINDKYPNNQKEFFEFYKEYTTFFKKLNNELNQGYRVIDKALWAFGKVLKQFQVYLGL